MEDSTERLIERFKKECSAARDILYRILLADSRKYENDVGFIEDGLGIVTGFNRSMKYLIGNKFLEELHNGSNTEDSSHQQTLSEANSSSFHGSISANSSFSDLDVAASKLKEIQSPSSISPLKSAVLNNNKIDNDIPYSPTKSVISIQNDCSLKKVSPETNNEETWISVCVEGSIPDQPKVQMNKNLSCFITHVENPGKFYISLDQVYESNDSILGEMDQFYKDNSALIKNPNIHINEAYAYFFEGRWVRVIVKDLVEENIASVFLIDYGNEEKAEYSKLYPLKNDFKNMVPLAFKCYLANIEPVDVNAGWGKRSKKFMKEKCSNISGSVVVLECAPDGSLGVLLNINDHLIHFDMIRKNIAVIAKKSVQSTVALADATNDNNQDNNVSIPTTNSLQTDVPLSCIVSHFVDPSNFYVRPSDPVTNKILDDIDKYYTENNPVLEKSNKTLFAVFYENTWNRVSITNTLNITDAFVEVYFIDRGLTSNVLYSDLKSLCLQFSDIPPMALRCHLHEIAPKGGKWTNKSIKQTRNTILNKKSSVIIHESVSSSYGVTLRIDGISVNEKIISKEFGERMTKAEPLPDDVIPEIMNQPMGAEDEDVNICLAVQGHTANDEAEVCPHYRGPPATTCFKGSRCKKKHQLLNKDGWTIKRIPALMESDQIFPLPNTMIQLVMTCPINYKSFYGHIHNTNSSSDYKSSAVYNEMDGLKKLQSALNSTGSRNSLRTYDKMEVLPGIGELVAAYFPLDQQWYRGKICSIDDNECEVFYIDYGNKEDLRLDQVAELEKRYSELSPQAITFVIDNIYLPADYPDTHAAHTALYKLIADKLLYGFVTSVEANEVFIVLYENDFNVGDYLCELGYVNEKTYKVINPDDRVSRDAFRLYQQIEANAGRTVTYQPQIVGIFPG